ncbi:MULTISPECIES: hypothetical protein [Thermomonospora]|uniref:Holin n=1 Tax=Thermomonospora cellulosilytica TaxID=1411118 RepID=A0A7W3MXG5_9ACTN|nr:MULTISPECIES: hypothetical protein [Thermomonospora]MBA9003651.1 hypothetical protein [Thermomonospora cellulosilytica]
MKISAYWKSVIAAAGPVLLAAQAAIEDGRIDSGEWIPIGVAVLVALGVWGIPNKPKTGGQVRQ